ncbi:hypothetical protein [Pantoea sp. 1.19]|uniref:hypothetical protein n=1 Tax=Pantoea sp. 1.19 TaxID=1925589 RepID=UPI0011150CA7|nr:hypothetical protein [Pantoea sp. 1.19]
MKQATAGDRPGYADHDEARRDYPAWVMTQAGGAMRFAAARQPQIEIDRQRITGQPSVLTGHQPAPGLPDWTRADATSTAAGAGAAQITLFSFRIWLVRAYRLHWQRIFSILTGPSRHAAGFPRFSPPLSR